MELIKLLTVSYFVQDDEVILKNCGIFLKSVRERDREIKKKFFKNIFFRVNLIISVFLKKPKRR